MRVNGLYEKFVLPVGIPAGSPIRVREAEVVEYTVPDRWSVALCLAMPPLPLHFCKSEDVRRWK